MSDPRDLLAEAAAKLRLAARYFERHAERVESLGELDAEAVEAVAAAKALTGRELGEGTCG